VSILRRRQTISDVTFSVKFMGAGAAAPNRGNLSLSPQIIPTADDEPSPVPPPHLVAFGIDLGTTFSEIASAFGAVPEVYEDPVTKMKAIPSWVQFRDNGAHDMGWTAYKGMRKNVPGTIYDVKRMFGREFTNPEITEGQKTWTFKTVASPENRVLVSVDLNGETKHFQPYEVSSILLKGLMKIANASQAIPTNRVVITVPAGFTAIQREETKKAAEAAGLELLRLVSEPTAAALAFAKRDQFDGVKTIMVFDFGGGTVDVSLVEVSRTGTKVLAIDGDAHLGGRDLDERLLNFCLNQMRPEQSAALLRNPRKVQALRDQCEEAKRNLSETDVWEFTVDGLLDGDEVDINITRSDFETECVDIFARALLPIPRVLKKSGKKADDITDVILVGGSSFIPKVQTDLEGLFNMKPYAPVNQQDAVAIGAAYLAREFVEDRIFDEISVNLPDSPEPPQPVSPQPQQKKTSDPTGKRQRFACVEVVPDTIGIISDDGEMMPAIQRGVPLPASGDVYGARHLTSLADIRVPIVQGNHRVGMANKHIGTAVICSPFIPTIGADGDYAWRLKFHLDENGCLTLDGFVGGFSGRIGKIDDEEPRTVRFDESPPERAEPSGCPAEMIEELVRNAELFADSLRTDTFVRTRFGPAGIWSALKRQLTMAQSLAKGGTATMADYEALRQWLSDNLLVIMSAAGRSPPGWLSRHA
jgi:molecular chaperone DnaK (HSP70)